MFGRISRRRLARAAIERLESQHRAATFVAEGERAEAERARAEASRDRHKLASMAQRLDDANAELARWGLEPVTRDEPESDEHPARYRRHSDWRTTRTGAELEELLARSIECSPPGVEVTIERGELPDEYEPVAWPVEDERAALIEWTGPVHAEQSNADLVAEVRSVLTDTREALRDRELNPRGLVSRTRELLERLDPADPMCIVSGEVHQGLAAALADQAEATHAMRLELRAANDREADARSEVKRLQLRIGEAHAAGWLEGAGTMSTGELGLEAPWPERAAALRRQRDAMREQLEARTAACDALRAERDALVESLPTRTREAEAEVTRLRAQTSHLDAELAEAITRANDAEAELGEAQHRIGDLQGDLGVARGGLASEADRLRAELTAERTEREQAERSRDRAVAKADQLGLELEQIRTGDGFKVPQQGDTFTIRTRDNMGDVRCRVVSVAPLGDFGFSLMLEPADAVPE